MGRVHLCTACLGASAVPTTGGPVRCGRCGVEDVLPPRDLRPLGDAVGPYPQGDRIERLRGQDGRLMLLPTEVARLLVGGTVAEGRQAEAWSVWQSRRAALRQGPSGDNEETLFALSLLLADALSQEGDALRERGVYEAALDVLRLPRHQQGLRAAMARRAVRLGALDEAEAWLATCDRHSTDLESDTAWRLAQALLETARARFEAVLELLGKEVVEVPIHDAMEGLATLLRCHARERLGDGTAAVAMLERYLRGVGVDGAEALQRYAAQHATLRLCAESLPVALNTFDAHAAERAAELAMGGGGSVFQVVGVGIWLLSVPLFREYYLTVYRARPGDVMPWWPGVMVAALGLMFFWGGRRTSADARRLKRLWRVGDKATGQILGFHRTGVVSGEIDQVSLTLQVTKVGLAPYEAEAKVLMQPEVASRIVVGATVPLRVDPDDARSVMIALL